MQLLYLALSTIPTAGRLRNVLLLVYAAIVYNRGNFIENLETFLYKATFVYSWPEPGAERVQPGLV